MGRMGRKGRMGRMIARLHAPGSRNRKGKRFPAGAAAWFCRARIDRPGIRLFAGFGRPFGTLTVWWAGVPPLKGVGYCRVSLRDRRRGGAKHRLQPGEMGVRQISSESYFFQHFCGMATWLATSAAGGLPAGDTADYQSALPG
jgi:hypothetical protein